jgi:L-iditol 2-dehydrogenase
MAMRGRAAILDQPNGAFVVDEAEVPDPDPNGLLVRQELCGICATDTYVYRGGLPGVTFPLVLGHETVGVVERLGANVGEDSTGRPLAAGDRVYIQPGMSCRQCVYCVVHRQPTLCLKRRGYGFRPFKDQPPHFQGGYSEYLALAPGSTYLQMNADAATSVVLEPLTIGLHQISRVEMPVGATAVIQGAGAIGILTLVAAKEAGALRTIVLGAPDSRLDLARAFGADVTISIEEMPDPAERVRLVREETPGGFGADVVFECTGVPSSIPEGIDMLRRGGTYVEAGHYTDHGDVALNPFRHMVHKQITLVAVWGADTPHFVAGRALIESGKYPFADLVSHQLPLERAGDGIAAIGGTYRIDGEEIRKVAIAGHGG